MLRKPLVAYLIVRATGFWVTQNSDPSINVKTSQQIAVLQNLVVAISIIATSIAQVCTSVYCSIRSGSQTQTGMKGDCHQIRRRPLSRSVLSCCRVRRMAKLLAKSDAYKQKKWFEPESFKKVEAHFQQIITRNSLG